MNSRAEGHSASEEAGEDGTGAACAGMPSANRKVKMVFISKIYRKPFGKAILTDKVRTRSNKE